MSRNNQGKNHLIVHDTCGLEKTTIQTFSRVLLIVISMQKKFDKNSNVSLFIFSSTQENVITFHSKFNFRTMYPLLGIHFTLYCIRFGS